VDWWLVTPAFLLSSAGLVSMNSFQSPSVSAAASSLFEHQIIWLFFSLILFFIASLIDWRFLRRSGVVAGLFAILCLILLSLFVVGSIFKGAQSWFNFGLFALQPSEPAKLILVLVLAKYFTRRHIEIAHIRHILVSALYTFIIFLLIFIQPDFGSAIIIFLIWFGMVIVSGISKKHLFLVLATGAVIFAVLWFYVFAPYQKQRIETFLNPLTDIQGSGYNAYQSMIAVGSGQIFGKGIGYGTQSKLQFLPEYETDFIFASFAEEWGFVGVLILFGGFSVLIWRILKNSAHGSTNFEILFSAGVAIIFMAQFMIHVGMNIGLLPVTGTTIPFMSYGGSHLLTEFAALGIVAGMRRYGRAIHGEKQEREILGITREVGSL